MGGKSSPPAPDYAAAAQQQGAANQATAVTQANLNNPNMVTPYGTSTYSGPLDGSDRGTLTQTLSPDEQSKLDLGNQAQIGALGILNSDMPNISNALSGSFGLTGPQAGVSTGNDVRGYAPLTQRNVGNAGNIQDSLDFTGSPQLVGTDQATRQGVANSQYALGAQYLDPQFQQQKSDLDSQLANQGITPGSAAYDRAMLNFNNTKQKAYSDLSNNSINTGNTALAQQQAAAVANRGQVSGETQAAGQFQQAGQSQLYNQLLQSLLANNAGVAQGANIASTADQLQNSGQSQLYSQYASNRTMPINMLNALLSSSQVNNPTFQPTTPTSITPAPILQGAQLQGQQNAAQASANAGKLGSVLGAGANLGSAAILHSDRRMKSNILQIGVTPGGLGVYSYQIFGQPSIGVMADEAEVLFPDAVSMHPNGFKLVDYRKVR